LHTPFTTGVLEKQLQLGYEPNTISILIIVVEKNKATEK
jgi:hypothetical protein